MEITKQLYVKNRKEWRKWLSINHNKEKEIWLVYYNKKSNKTRIPYDDAVEEALCYGWIDSTVKKLDQDSTVQRFTPRNIKSSWSELNKERFRRLIKKGVVTKYGLEKAKWVKDDDNSLIIPKYIIKELSKDPVVLENFNKFPLYYKKIRINYMNGYKKNSKEFEKRLSYFIKMTKLNKRFGMMK